jgi:[protein-PII] uridylyltransferase
MTPNEIARDALTALPANPADLKQYIVAQKKIISQTNDPNQLGLALSHKLTHFYDDIVAHVFQEIIPPQGLNFCIVALGGYGRNELNIFSDIDINFIYKGDPAAEIPAIKECVHTIVKRLWDIGLEIGHSVRSIDDCVHLAGQDPDIKTSFLEARRICGEPSCYDAFQKAIREIMFQTHLEEFVSDRLAVMQKRHEQFGNSTRMLEPHLKEGAGGLRDIHACLWIAQAWSMSRNAALRNDASESLSVLMFRRLAEEQLLSYPLVETFVASFEFLLKTRNILHLLGNRKNDILSYPMQAQVAAFLRYEDRLDSKGVEEFMREFYLHSRSISRTTALVLEKLKTVLQNKNAVSENIVIEHNFFVNEEKLYYSGDVERAVRERPAWLMSLFFYCQNYHVQLSEALQSVVREHLSLVDPLFLASKEAAHDFLEIWKFEGQISSALRSMHELGFLEKYLPEFGFIVAHYKYNVYHAYTTDEHLIVAVGQLEKLFYDDPSETSLAVLREIYQELSLFEKYQLYWAVFLHDIGKSRSGDHSLIGADLAKDIFQRLHYTDNADAVYFLIRNHLRMEQTAFRRNLKDADTIAEFGDLIGNRRWLRMLYLLTFADLSASNSAAWTEWKGLLLQELFIKADHYLKSKESSGQIKSDWDDILYDQIQRNDSLRVTFNDKSSFTEVLIVTNDQPYRLSQICGAMAVCDISIFDAQVNTRADGIIIDQFRVAHFSSHTPLAAAQKDQLNHLLNDVLVHGHTLEPRLTRLKARWKRLKFSAAETEIYFEDNRKFTILDIFTADRIGLLYLITRALSDLELNIHAAKIGTRLDHAADCFYVLDRDGHKISSIPKQDEIRRTIMHRLTNPVF